MGFAAGDIYRSGGDGGGISIEDVLAALQDTEYIEITNSGEQIFISLLFDKTKNDILTAVEGDNFITAEYDEGTGILNLTFDISKVINDGNTNYTTTWTSQKIVDFVTNLIQEIPSSLLNFVGYISPSDPTPEGGALKDGTLWLTGEQTGSPDGEGFPLDLQKWSESGEAWSDYDYTPSDWDVFYNNNDDSTWYWFAGKWHLLNFSIDLSNYVTYDYQNPINEAELTVLGGNGATTLGVYSPSQAAANDPPGIEITIPQNIPFGVSTTTGSSATKTVTISNVKVELGTVIAVAFQSPNTAAAGMVLNVIDSTGEIVPTATISGQGNVSAGLQGSSNILANNTLIGYAAKFYYFQYSSRSASSNNVYWNLINPDQTAPNFASLTLEDSGGNTLGTYNPVQGSTPNPIVIPNTGGGGGGNASLNVLFNGVSTPGGNPSVDGNPYMPGGLPNQQIQITYNPLDLGGGGGNNTGGIFSFDAPSFNSFTAIPGAANDGSMDNYTDSNGNPCYWDGQIGGKVWYNFSLVPEEALFLYCKSGTQNSIVNFYGVPKNNQRIFFANANTTANTQFNIATGRAATGVGTMNLTFNTLQVIFKNFNLWRWISPSTSEFAIP